MKNPFRTLKALSFEDILHCGVGFIAAVIILGIYLGSIPPRLERANAQIVDGGRTYLLEAHDVESLSFPSDTSTTFTAGNLNSDPKTQRVTWIVEGNNLRFFWDGSSPTASLGMLAKVGQTVDIIGYKNIQNFLGIGIDGTSTGEAVFENLKQLQK